VGPMSLTSELDDPRSAVSLFLGQKFPNLKALRDWSRPQFSTFAGPLRIAPPQIIRERPALLGTIGMAFDYFAVTPPDEFVARIGASRLLYLMPTGEHPAWERLIARLFGETIPSITERLAPAGSRLSDRHEKELCQLCYVLGFFEEMYRAPPQYVMQSRLLSLERAGAPTMDELLAPA
jgi:hypothetical protein